MGWKIGNPDLVWCQNPIEAHSHRAAVEVEQSAEPLVSLDPVVSGNSSSRSPPMIVVEQAPEPGPARAFAGAVVVRRSNHRADDPTVESLVITLAVVVNDEFAHQVSEVPFAYDTKWSRHFFPHGLNEAL
jgi:hypothetical protein